MGKMARIGPGLAQVRIEFHEIAKKQINPEIPRTVTDDMLADVMRNLGLTKIQINRVQVARTRRKKSRFEWEY